MPPPGRGKSVTHVSGIPCYLCLRKDIGTRTYGSAVGSTVLDEGIGESNLDERLPGHAKSTSLLIDLPQEVYWEIDVHALDRAAGPDGLRQVHVSRQINASVVLGVEFGGRECPTLGGTLL